MAVGKSTTIVAATSKREIRIVIARPLATNGSAEGKEYTTRHSLYEESGGT